MRPLASAVRESLVSSVLGLGVGCLFLAVVALGDRPAHDVLRLLVGALLWCALFGCVVYVLVRRRLGRLVEPPTRAREPVPVTLWRCCLQGGAWIALLVVFTLAVGNPAATGGLALGNGLLSILLVGWWTRFERRNRVLLLREPRISWSRSTPLFAAPRPSV